MMMDMIVILLTIQHLKIVIVFIYFFFTSRWRCRCFSTLTQICWMTRGWTMLMILCCLTHSSHPKTRKSSIQGNRPTCLLMHSVNLFDLLTFWSPLNNEIKRKRLRFLVISVIAVGALFQRLALEESLFSGWKDKKEKENWLIDFVWILNPYA